MIHSSAYAPAAPPRWHGADRNNFCINRPRGSRAIDRMCPLYKRRRFFGSTHPIPRSDRPVMGKKSTSWTGRADPDGRPRHAPDPGARAESPEHGRVRRNATPPDHYLPRGLARLGPRRGAAFGTRPGDAPGSGSVPRRGLRRGTRACGGPAPGLARGRRTRHTDTLITRLWSEHGRQRSVHTTCATVTCDRS